MTVRHALSYTRTFLGAPTHYLAEVPDDAWSRRQSESIGRQVKARREERGWSARELAARCEQIGHAVPVAVIHNLESGRRASVPVTDLLVLAAALDVAPLVLLFPVGQTEPVEVLPGVETDAWAAAGWFGGEVRGTDAPGGAAVQDPFTFQRNAEPLLALRQHDALLARHRRARVRWHLALRRATSQPREGDVDPDVVNAEVDAERRAIGDAEELLLGARRRLRDLGITPPRLPEELAGLDDADAAP